MTIPEAIKIVVNTTWRSTFTHATELTEDQINACLKLEEIFKTTKEGYLDD